MRYCSKEHQIADWKSHKLLCKSFAKLQECPGDGLCRAISFPEDCKQPCFIWIPSVIEEDSLSDEDELEESSSSSDDEQDEIKSIVEGQRDEAEDIGWDDARANPTGYEIPDTTLPDERSGSSWSTAGTSFEDEEEPREGVQLQWRCSSDNTDTARPNKCVATLINERAAERFQGSWELYGVSRATGCSVDLDTTLLSVALSLIAEQGAFEDHCECPEGLIASAAAVVQELEGDVLDVVDGDDDGLMVGLPLVAV